MPRLYLPTLTSAPQIIDLPEGQAHYLHHVMRLKPGDKLSVFNATVGEWEAEIRHAHKKNVTIEVLKNIKEPSASPDLWLAFAPIKQGRIDILVEKATELGVSRLCPVFTHHTVVARLNMERLQAHAIEAAEQCERLDIPSWHPPCKLPELLGHWPSERLLLYGDESGQSADIQSLLALLATLPAQPLGLLIGPEGGFSADEHQLLNKTSFIRGFCLGPRILRADTAAIAALACIQSVCGDWQKKPKFNAV